MGQRQFARGDPISETIDQSNRFQQLINLVVAKSPVCPDAVPVRIQTREEGVQKPHPDSSQASFVGHKKSELDGAKTVGMTTIALHYEPSAQADHFIEQFNELLELFPSINGKESG
jgi:hypothetical protein